MSLIFVQIWCWSRFFAVSLLNILGGGAGGDEDQENDDNDASTGKDSVLQECVLVVRARGGVVVDCCADLVLIAFLCCFAA